MSFTVNVLVRTTVLLAVVGLLSCLMRRNSASMRHAIWASGLLAVLAFPIVSMFIPPVAIAILDSSIRRKRMSKLTTAALLLMTAVLTLPLAVIEVTPVSAMPLPPAMTAQVVKPAQETPPGYVVNRAPMSYPPEALQKRVEGTVVVELSFNSRGEMVDSHVLSGPEELRQAALQTALQGKYAINLERSLQVVVDFKLPTAGTGQLSGTINDPSRAPLQGAMITATNTQSGKVTSVSSNAAGSYQFQGLAPGAYRLKAELSGFQVQSMDNVQLGSTQPIRLNFILQPNGAVQPQQKYGVLEGIEIRGLTEPLSTEIRQRLERLRGRPITSELGYEVGAAVGATSWGSKPFGIIFAPRVGTNSSDLQITFYDSASLPKRVRVGGSVLALNLLQQVKPIYPQAAKDAKIQGVVVLEVNIGTDGRVVGVNVITGHPFLIQPAVDAVQQWVYKPVTVDGQAVDVISTVAVNFAFQE